MTLCGQAFALAPAVNGVFHHAQMTGDINCGNPGFGIHTVGAPDEVLKSF